MNVLIDLFSFFFILVFSYFSILGFRLSNKNTINNFKENQCDDFFSGLLIFLIIGFLFDLLNLNNKFLNLALLLSGFFLYIFRKRYKNKFLSINIAIFFLLFSGLLIAKTHEDFNAYHFFAIKDIFNNTLSIGQSNIDIRLSHTSLLAYVQTLFILPYFDFKLIHIPIYLIYVLTVFYFVEILLKKKQNIEFCYSLFVLLLLLIKFTRLSEYGYDYISQFLIFIIFHKIFFYCQNSNEIKKSIIIFFLSVCIKHVNLIFLPILFYPYFKNKKNFIFLLDLKLILKIFVICLIIITNSFLRTGCIFYPLNQTCFENTTVIWSSKKEIGNYDDIVKLWSKGFYHQDKGNLKKITDKNKYQKNFNWVPTWIEIHFFYKIFEYIILNIFIILFFFYLSKIEFKKNFLIHKNKDLIGMKILLLTALFSWFLLIPQFRFGFSYISIFLIFLFISFIKNISFDVKKVLTFILIGFFIFNYKNINRIKKELSRKDQYTYKFFPWFDQNMKIQKRSKNFKIVKAKNYIIFHK